METKQLKPAREQIVQAASDLMENQGYHATGINEIVAKSGAPKGSIYYYFPEGKDAIAGEAVEIAGRALVGRIRENLAQNADLAGSIQSFLEGIAHYVELSGFTSGGPLSIVASETATTNEKLNQVCRGAYTEMIGAFEEKILASGCSPDRASSLAWMVTSTIEGAIILSRTFHSGEPLRRAGHELANLVKSNR
jgi:TetR/AcrR family transcriptional repressor of lmrAB and yxaGH operons